MRLMLGNALDFPVPQVSPTETWNKWPFLVLGAILGVAGAIYNALSWDCFALATRCRIFRRCSAPQ